MTFDPKTQMTKIKGKDYLEVKWRIVWFRDKHPNGEIRTEVCNFSPMVIKANILVDGILIASGHGMAVSEGREVWNGREIEKAETAAIGRALAHAGFGTQFTGEDEEEHLADSPVEKHSTNGAKNTRPLEPVQLRSMLAKKVLEYQGKEASVKFRSFIAGAIGSCLKDDRERYAVTEYLTGKTSIKDVSDEMVFAFRDWLGMGEGSEPSDEANQEIQKVLRAALKEQGQTEMEV